MLVDKSIFQLLQKLPAIHSAELDDLIEHCKADDTVAHLIDIISLLKATKKFRHATDPGLLGFFRNNLASQKTVQKILAEMADALWVIELYILDVDIYSAEIAEAAKICIKSILARLADLEPTDKVLIAYQDPNNELNKIIKKLAAKLAIDLSATYNPISAEIPDPNINSAAEPVGAIAPITDSTPLLISNNDFAPLRELGRGNFGCVTLYYYKHFNTAAANPKIMALCDDKGRIVIKRMLANPANNPAENAAQLAEFQQEQKISDHLYRMHGNYAHATSAVDEAGVPLLIGKYIAFHENPAATTPKSQYKGYNLNSFLQKMAVARGYTVYKDAARKQVLKAGKTIIQPTYQAIETDFDIILAQIADSMQSSLHAMHEAGTYHLDIAPRNFLMNKPYYDENHQLVKVSVIAADFGKSSTVQSNGLSDRFIESYGPLRGYDLTTLHGVNELNNYKSSQFTGRADLFAVRISLLNMLAIDLVGEENAPIYINYGENFGYNAFNRVTNYDNDQAILTKYVDNLQTLIKGCTASPATKQRVQLFIDCYRDYIIQTPWHYWHEPYSVEESKKDAEKFLLANDRLFVRLLVAKYNKLASAKQQTPEQLQEFVLSLKRLTQIAVSNQLVQSKLYSNLMNIINNANYHNVTALQPIIVAYLTEIKKTPDAINVAVATMPETAEAATDFAKMPQEKEADIKKLAESLAALNKTFRDHSRYYHRAFFSRLKPLRNLFIDKNKAFEALGNLKTALAINVAEIKQYQELLLSFQNNKLDAVFSENIAKKQLRQWKGRFKVFQEKYTNYHKYLLLELESFEQRLLAMQDKHRLDEDKLMALQIEVKAFVELLPDASIADQYQQCFGLKKIDMLQQANELQLQLEQLKPVPMESKAVDAEVGLILGAQPLRSRNADSSTEDKKIKTPPSFLKNLLTEWQAFIKQQKWESQKLNSQELKVIPGAKNSKMFFTVNVKSNKLTYQRPLAFDNKSNQISQEEKLVEAMVKAFLMTGRQSLMIEGSEKLCELAVTYLQKTNPNLQLTVKTAAGIKYFPEDNIPQAELIQKKQPE